MKIYCTHIKNITNQGRSLGKNFMKLQKRKVRLSLNNKILKSKFLSISYVYDGLKRLTIVNTLQL